MVALMALTRSLMERRPMPGVDDAEDGAVIDEAVGEGDCGVAAVWAMVSVVWGAAGL